MSMSNLIGSVLSSHGSSSTTGGGANGGSGVTSILPTYRTPMKNITRNKRGGE